MKFISIALFVFFSSQSIASDTAKILTEREITFNDRTVLKLDLKTNDLVNKFSYVCTTFNPTVGSIKESYAKYRKDNGIDTETISDYLGNDPSTCQLAYGKWEAYLRLSFEACNIAKTTGYGEDISSCNKLISKESSFFGYLELLTTEATDIFNKMLNQNKLVQIGKDKKNRLAKIEARKKSLAKSNKLTSEISKQQTDDCISELEDIYSLDELMLTNLTESVDSVGVALNADLIDEASKKLTSISTEKPLILTGNEFCQTLPEYKSKYDEIGKGYSEIITQFKSYNTKIQAEILKRKQASLAKKKKAELAVRKTIQSAPKQIRRQSQPTSSMTQPYIKEGRLFCSSKAQFDEQITWLAQNIEEFVNGCGATLANIPVIVLDTSMFRGNAKVRGINNKMVYYIAMESLTYP